MRKIILILFLAAIGLLFYLRPDRGERVENTQFDPVPTSMEAGTIVVDFQDGLDEEDIQRLGAIYGLNFEYSSALSKDEALVVAQVSNVAKALKSLEDEPLIEAAEPQFELKMLGYPNDPMYGKQWNLRAISAPAAWRVSRGEGVKVGVLDTGVSPVEDLQGVELLPGVSFVPGASSAADDHGHGTHVAGTIAQATNNGKGVAGVAFQATIVPYKVLSATGAGKHDWIASAIDQAADDGCDVINLSLGSNRYSKVIAVAVKKAQKRGVVVVAAAGNTGGRGVGFPGALKGVIAVTAMGPGMKGLAPYSSYGPGVELAAPGGNTSIPGGGILQDTIDGKGGHAYQSFQGTSMASPHVAGAVAIMRGMGLSGEAAVDSLFASAIGVKVGKIGERYGHGVMNVGLATQLVQFKYFGSRFMVAGLLGTLLGLLLLGSPTAAVVTGLGSAIVAGGLFYLPLLDWAIPVLSDSPSRLLSLVSRGLLEWPAAFGLPNFVQSPLWASAFVPMAAVYVLGPWRGTWMVSASIALGFGISLISAGIGGTIHVHFLGSTMSALWLMGNGAVSLMAALAVFGVQRQRRATS